MPRTLGVIDHGDGYQTTYNHLSGIGVSVGDTVSTGDHMGGRGSTGNSMASNLHFEVTKDAEFIDPEIWLGWQTFPLGWSSHDPELTEPPPSCSPLKGALPRTPDWFTPQDRGAAARVDPRAAGRGARGLRGGRR